jgi:hypothetical protein
VGQIEISVILVSKEVGENVGYQRTIEGSSAFRRGNEVEGEEHAVRGEVEAVARDDFVGAEVSIWW